MSIYLVLHEDFLFRNLILKGSLTNVAPFVLRMPRSSNVEYLGLDT